MVRRATRWVVAGVVLAGVAAAALCLAPWSARDRLYREVSYQVLSDRATEGASTDLERVFRLFDYTRLQLNAVGGTVIDMHSWNDLVNCDSV